ncbi:MAG: type II toxin-antitoxin system Phd/YefM family antitoxin, partial [Candidatus Levybacteria bacterium]|nr:type II toxin-antitoxin system Phd/YefM family antitoxin [Candidatus Levybacteria bacterium]
MIQIINISEARNTLSSLVKKINKTQMPIIIVQDSKPAVVVYPYKQIQTDRAKEKEFQQEFEALLASGKRLF